LILKYIVMKGKKRTNHYFLFFNIFTMTARQKTLICAYATIACFLTLSVFFDLPRIGNSENDGDLGVRKGASGNVVHDKGGLSLRHMQLEDKWLVILTTCRERGDPESTKKHSMLYMENIMKWSNLSLPLIVVENSGIGYPELEHNLTNLDVVVSNSSNPGSDNVSKAKSFAEASSLDSVIEYIDNATKYENYTHLLKVTGRYFLEGIEDRIRSLPKGKDFYLQKCCFNTKIKGQKHSEYFGIRRGLVKELTSTVRGEAGNHWVIMEAALGKVSRKYSSVKIPKGFPNSQPRGGDGRIFNPLL